MISSLKKFDKVSYANAPKVTQSAEYPSEKNPLKTNLSTKRKCICFSKPFSYMQSLLRVGQLVCFISLWLLILAYLKFKINMR